MYKNNDVSDESFSCDKFQPQKEYTHIQELVDNLPYILMTIIGAAIHVVGFKFSFWGLCTAAAYIIFAGAGTFCIILFVCPYCHYYGTRACPCGYGQIAAKFRKKRGENQFAEKFKKLIPVIVPLWIIPLISGIIFLSTEFDFLMLILTIVFVINAYIILPLVARIYGCGHCPQKNDCPWMVKERAVS